ncbi:MAG: D-alanyl-D-alanine carboxypeptidase family protein [Oscillospiraceae bacterium]
MQTHTFSKEDVHRGALRLVSASHPLANGLPALARPLEVLGTTEAGEVVLMEEAAARMMRCLLQSAACCGRLQPVSGFRSREEQHDIFESTLKERGEAFARSYVALPGCSEHETGLAVDLANAQSIVDFITPDFPAEGRFARFADLCSLYGFIERYPKGKSDVTGIAFEPWHFRYVGQPHARIMQKNGWTLEEYVAVLRKHKSLKRALVHREKSYSVRVFMLPLSTRGTAGISLPEGAVWQASGNNVDGVVVSVWE